MSAAWFACEHPERPTDPWVRWHYADEDCLACRLKAVALHRQYPDDPHVAWVVQMIAAGETP